MFASMIESVIMPRLGTGANASLFIGVAPRAMAVLRASSASRVGVFLAGYSKIREARQSSLVSASSWMPGSSPGKTTSYDSNALRYSRA
jgi:hypothetical protein